jgi:hypothetical protein
VAAPTPAALPPKPAPQAGEIAGLNWYHAGNANTDASGAMSDAMIETIGAANLHQKPYAAPAPAEAAVASA